MLTAARHRPRSHQTAGRGHRQTQPDIPGVILLLYDVLCTWHVVVQSAAAGAAALCVAVLLLLLQQLLLFVIVCRMAKIVAGVLNLIPSNVFFLFIQTRFIFNVCTPWQYCRICIANTYNVYQYFCILADI